MASKWGIPRELRVRGNLIVTIYLLDLMYFTTHAGFRLWKVNSRKFYAVPADDLIAPVRKRNRLRHQWSWSPSPQHSECGCGEVLEEIKVEMKEDLEQKKISTDNSLASTGQWSRWAIQSNSCQYFLKFAQKKWQVWDEKSLEVVHVYSYKKYCSTRVNQTYSVPGNGR